MSGTVRFLQTAGERHEGEARQLEIPPTPLAELADGGVGKEFAFEGEQPIQGRIRLRADDVGDGLARVRMCVHNSTPVENGAEMKRGEALKASLISTHVVIETTAGRFASPLERSGPAGEAVAAVRERQFVPRPRRSRGPGDHGRGDRPARPPVSSRPTAWGTSSTTPRSRRR